MLKIFKNPGFKPKPPRHRDRALHRDFDNTTFGRILRHNEDALRNRGSKLYAQFRRRQRVPFEIFQQLLQKTNEWFAPSKDAIGIPSAPNSHKLLGVLRILGRGWCFDDAAEAAGMGEETIRTFFHNWIPRFVAEMKDIWLRPPRTEAEIKESTDLYAVHGFPGCICSMDVVHVYWDMCPAGWRHAFTGKSGRPTIAYNFCVNHKKKIYSITRGQAGARNDKTIIRFDTFAMAIHNKSIYADVPFEVSPLLCFHLFTYR
jgi:hypothetical protein